MRHVDHLIVVHAIDDVLVAVAVDIVQLAAQVVGVGCPLRERIENFANLLTKPGTGPAQMGFQNLADIHPAWHAERVQDDIYRTPVF